MENSTALIRELLQVAQFTFRKVKGAEVLPEVDAGELYVDGNKQTESPRFALNRASSRSMEAEVLSPQIATLSYARA